MDACLMRINLAPYLVGYLLTHHRQHHSEDGLRVGASFLASWTVMLPTHACSANSVRPNLD